VASSPAIRLGVDIGGTFTDVALEVGDRRYTAKGLTTARAPEAGVLAIVRAIIGEAGVKPGDVQLIIHGTTLATNALIERKGAKTALLTTEGFRDVVEIRHENRFEQYDVNIDLPPPLVPRRLRLPIRERIDAQGNVLQGHVVAMDAKDCVVHSETRLTAVVGVTDLVVVSTNDAVMVVPRSRSQEVKELVAKLKSTNRPEATVHKRMHRPWGYYESIDMGDRFQVKRIVVTPGGLLSLQKHRHRSEHWIVVRGTAEVTINENVRAVHENESVYIPIGSVHRLANQGRIPLELIEVQTGSYLGEDDIVRLEDVYSRA